MTGKEKKIQQRLIACKCLWYAFGIIELLVMVCFMVLPAITKFSVLFSLYELAIEEEMLLVWCIYFVVLLLVSVLDVAITIVVAYVFFGKINEAAFESIEKLLRGKGLSLSQ